MLAVPHNTRKCEMTQLVGLHVTRYVVSQYVPLLSSRGDLFLSRGVRATDRVQGEAMHSFQTLWLASDTRVVHLMPLLHLNSIMRLYLIQRDQPSFVR